MKRTLASSGYTIIEVMIVLVISGGMLVSVATMISGQQRRTEFITATREMESKMQDIFNDAESGVFPNNGTTVCTSDPTNALPPTIAAGVADQGTNSSCIFLGKAIQFYQDASTGGLVSKYNVMPIVGKRQYTASGSLYDVLNIGDAHPTAFWKNGAANTYETGVMNNGLQLDRVIYFGTSPLKTTQGVAAISSIGAGGTKEGSAISSIDGGPRLGVLDINNTNGSLADLQTSIGIINSASLTSASKGIVMCINDGAGGRRAAITVGLKFNTANVPEASGQRTATDTFFNDAEINALGCPAV